jgi:hypothetical protein
MPILIDPFGPVDARRQYRNAGASPEIEAGGQAIAAGVPTVVTQDG